MHVAVSDCNFDRTSNYCILPNIEYIFVQTNLDLCELK